MTAWWYWLLFALTVLLVACVARDIHRTIRRSNRYLRLNEEQRDRLIEDLLWHAHRKPTYLLALELREKRLATIRRAQTTEPYPLPDLLRADVIA